MASNGQYVNAYIKNIRCLKYKGESTYFDASFKYNFGKNNYDAWSHPNLFDEEKYGNIMVWYNRSESQAIDITKIQREGHFVFVGNKEGYNLKFAVRNDNYNESAVLAQSLVEYLNVPESTYNSQFNKLIVELSNKSAETIIDEIFNMSACLVEKLNAEWRFFFFEKIINQDATISEREAICINRLFSTVKDETQAATLISSIKLKGYEYKLLKSFTNLRSTTFTNVANGLSWLYYTQNKNKILEEGKNVNAENFFAWEPFGNVKEQYQSVMSNPAFSTFFDWMYDTRTYTYTVSLEDDGRFRVHVVGSEFSHAGPSTYHDNFYIDPYETVSVYFASRNKYVNIENHTVMMPGIMLAWIIDQGERETNRMLIELGLTAASFYLGGAAIISATGKSGKIINTILFMKGLTDKILESPEILSILIKEKGDKGDIFINTYKNISNIIDCGFIFKQFADKEINQKLLMLSKAWGEVGNHVKEELKNNHPTTFNYIQSKISELDKFN